MKAVDIEVYTRMFCCKAAKSNCPHLLAKMQLKSLDFIMAEPLCLRCWQTVLIAKKLQMS